jgi:hypothetical protein
MIGVSLDANVDMNPLLCDVSQNQLLLINEKYSYSVAYLPSNSRGDFGSNKSIDSWM